MSTRAIRTTGTHAACDVCGRTLLRGERAEIYLSGGTRRSVCELCTTRAIHGGWVREGEVPSYDDASARPERRRSLLSRLRSRREEPAGAPEPPRDPRRHRQSAPAPDLSLDESERLPPPPWEDEPGERRTGDRDRQPGERQPGRGTRRRGGAPPTSPSWPSPVSRAAARFAPGRAAGDAREPRHVRAVPTNAEHRIASAVSLFNESEHTRTVAGVARSLGLPDVSVQPVDSNPSAVGLVVSWELCWYRYEVDLSDDVPDVRVAGQGYELAELSDAERAPNAAADERGRLRLR